MKDEKQRDVKVGYTVNRDQPHANCCQCTAYCGDPHCAVTRRCDQCGNETWTAAELVVGGRMRYVQRCPACHQEAWTWRWKPINGMMLKPSLFLHAQDPIDVKAITCQSCGLLFPKDYFESSRWRDDLIAEEDPTHASQ